MLSIQKGRERWGNKQVEENQKALRQRKQNNLLNSFKFSEKDLALFEKWFLLAFSELRFLSPLGFRCWLRASLVAPLVKNLPAMQKTWVWSLGWEDPLEKGTAIHSSILAWRIPWTEESMGSAKSWTQLSDFHFK